MTGLKPGPCQNTSTHARQLCKEAADPNTLAYHAEET